MTDFLGNSIGEASGGFDFSDASRDVRDSSGSMGGVASVRELQLG